MKKARRHFRRVIVKAVPADPADAAVADARRAANRRIARGMRARWRFRNNPHRPQPLRRGNHPRLRRARPLQTAPHLTNAGAADADRVVVEALTAAAAEAVVLPRRGSSRYFETRSGSADWPSRIALF